MDQRVDTLQGTGKVTLDEVVDDHYLDVAPVNVGEALLILGIFCGPDDADNDQQVRVGFSRMTVRCLLSDTVALFG